MSTRLRIPEILNNCPKSTHFRADPSILLRTIPRVSRVVLCEAQQRPGGGEQVGENQTPSIIYNYYSILLILLSQRPATPRKRSAEPFGARPARRRRERRHVVGPSCQRPKLGPSAKICKIRFPQIWRTCAEFWKICANLKSWKFAKTI